MIKQSNNRTVEILIADDDPDDIRLALEGIQASGFRHHVTVVHDGVEAMAVLFGEGQYVNTPKPDLILLDLNLPKKKGREVLAEIKGNVQFRRIPIVIWSTSRAAGDVDEAYLLLANCYVAKPVGLDRSIQVVREIVEFWLGTAELPGH
jgi:two-component system, chemotaxis family, response regulator Rcp1